MRYATFDSSGVLNARYDDAINVIPSGAIQLDDELFFRTISEQDGVWMLNDDGTVTKHPFPPPTPEQILQANQSQQSYLLSLASQAMAPILVSLQLGDATDDETTNARAWQSYYRALKVVDMTAPTPDWPQPPDQQLL